MVGKAVNLSENEAGKADFVIEDPSTGRTRAIEVKSGKNYRRHSALTNLLEAREIQEALVLHDGNLEVEGDRIYAPVYATHLAMRI